MIYVNNEEWRLIDTGTNNAFYNMAVDEAIMKTCRKGKVPPTIRFYQWSPPGLSLGYFQQLHSEVDCATCKEHGVDIVRRLTGGRAILHDDELTYSIVGRDTEDFLPKSVLESYKVISRGIIKGLQSLGLDVELKPVEKNKKPDRGFSAACFDAPSWYEVVAGGKKLVGSAQTRQKGVILQHGSIPFSLNTDTLFRLLNISDERMRQRLKGRFQKKATSLNQQSGTKLQLKRVKNALRQGWEEVFGIGLKEGQLLPEEEKWIKELIENKYQAEDWNASK